MRYVHIIFGFVQIKQQFLFCFHVELILKFTRLFLKVHKVTHRVNGAENTFKYEIIKHRSCQYKQ